jgi:hypothetical protein
MSTAFHAPSTISMFKSLKMHTTKLHKPLQLQNQIYIQHQRSGKPKPKKEKTPKPEPVVPGKETNA